MSVVFRDRKQTLTQNYRRLGLVHRLNAPAGGSEKRRDGAPEAPEDSLHINSSAMASTKKGLGETKVERDPETGKILRVVRDDDSFEFAGKKLRRNNPLDDPLDDLSDNEEGSGPIEKQEKPPASAIVQQLEQQADKEGQVEKKPRHQSRREDEWITRLIEKYGDDLTAMARDRKLNPMQQTEGDLRRRIRKWKQSQA